MKHSIREIYSVSSARGSFLATANYVNAHNITIDKSKIAQAQLDGTAYAMPTPYKTNIGRGVKVYDVAEDGAERIIKIFLFGERTWFDTEAERDEYRREYHEHKNNLINEHKERARLIAELEKLSLAQLSALVQQIG